MHLTPSLHSRDLRCRYPEDVDGWYHPLCSPLAPWAWSFIPDRISSAPTPKTAHLGFTEENGCIIKTSAQAKHKLQACKDPGLGSGFSIYHPCSSAEFLTFSDHFPSEDSPPLVGLWVGLKGEPLEKEPHRQAGTQRSSDASAFPVSSRPWSNCWIVISWKFYVPMAFIRISTCKVPYNWL